MIGKEVNIEKEGGVTMARRASIRIGSTAKISGGKVKVQTMVSNEKNHKSHDQDYQSEIASSSRSVFAVPGG